MTKKEEIYRKHWEQKWQGLTFQSLPEQQSHILDAMKEYANWYAYQCLQIAASKATAYIKDYDDPIVEKRSILSINFPPHD